MLFLERLELIIDNCIKLGLGEWTKNGTTFYVHDISTFENSIKPYSFSTFKRQLNYYGFITNYSNGLTFCNPKFTKHSKIPIQKKLGKKQERDKMYREKIKKTLSLFELEERIKNASKQLEIIRDKVEEVSKIHEKNEWCYTYYSPTPTASHSLTSSPSVSPYVSPCVSPTNFEFVSELEETLLGQVSI